jgi:hypothetical protein
VKVAFCGTRVFQLDDAENGGVESDTIIPFPLSGSWIVPSSGPSTMSADRNGSAGIQRREAEARAANCGVFVRDSIPSAVTVAAQCVHRVLLNGKLFGRRSNADCTNMNTSRTALRADRTSGELP